ncbi:MAG: lipid A biosynthesis acyltransferase [Pseudomonadota bacterium]
MAGPELDKPRKKKKKKKKSSWPENPGHPVYWPTRMGLGLLRLFSTLPVPVQGALADGLGTLLWATMPGRRQVARTNLELAFPEYTDRERRRVERGVFRASARALFEGGISWHAPDSKIADRYTISGLENLEQARAAGKGVILLGGHYTTLEISGRLLARHVPDLYPIYKEARNPVFNAAMVAGRRGNFPDVLINDDMRAILRVLRKGGVVWYAPDQDFGRRGSVFASFMGVQASTLTMTARLAKVSGAPMVPLYSERRPGNRWHLELGKPLDGFPSGDDEADARRVNAAIEHQVRRTPDQYLWLHHRYRTRPNKSDPSLYKDAKK